MSNFFGERQINTTFVNKDVLREHLLLRLLEITILESKVKYVYNLSN